MVVIGVGGGRTCVWRWLLRCPLPCLSKHYASRNGHGAICQFLLQSGARCNAQTHGGATALHRASYCGHVDVARLLLAYGADPGIADDDGMTSLHKAAVGGHRELCELLLQHSPVLKSIQDRRARRACDLVPGSGTLRDLLET
nr:ankyrin repeat domain-containing protein 39 [Chelonoidis abingdonii]